MQQQQQHHRHDDNDDDDDYYSSYRMTGLTGTLRVMAPEVIQCLPYGLPADVFSFGVCVWEVFGGERHDFCTAAEICRGDRPAIPSDDWTTGAGMPRTIRSLLDRCWSDDPTRRPTFSQVRDDLHRRLVELHGHVQTRRRDLPRPGVRRSNHHAEDAEDNDDTGGGGGSHRHPPHHAAPAEAATAAAAERAEAAFWRRLDLIPITTAVES
jgi:serine/threonine protein kinase